jgi:hypothetical protein
MKKLTILAVLLLAVSAIFAQDVKKDKKGPQITFKEDLHNYGDVYLGGDGTYEFVFTNTGNEPLILSKPRSSCGCTVPSWPKEPILPGEDNKIKVTYNTHKAGPFNKTVTVYSNAVNKSAIVLRIKGQVIQKPGEALPEKETSTGASPVNK